MGGLFSSPKMPAPVAPPPVPTQAANNTQITKAQQDEQARLQAGGRSSTVLNGGSGLGNLGTVSSTSGLLGGSGP
ncbi:hypothetical protein ACN9MB_09055 [Dyella kyungheensis]|jgi:hypothetical protein|uniref:hypothetical protein n=1 Tax=Dyella kyungheensis TaxID=1242174 RepID=UPI003CFA6081